MPNYQGQNYKVNRKVKEDVDKNQINYRESTDTPISIIKRVYVYVTDKKGYIIPEVDVTLDGTTVKTGYNGLLISNFPNQSKTITVEKEGYKSATANIILNAETQTHEFFLALEDSEDESEVISTDESKPKPEELIPCEELFIMEDSNELVTWSTKTNEIVDGTYTGHGSYIKEGWSNEGLWQLDFDIKYNSPESSYIRYYVGIMPFCTEDINPFTDANGEKYCMYSWETSARLSGLDAICLEGPANYKYLNAKEYHHGTVKKVAEDKIEYYFDNQKWVYAVPKLANLETLHFGIRDNPVDRNTGITISCQNVEVYKLCEKSSLATDGTTIALNEEYYFSSYGDSAGEEFLSDGTVKIIGLASNNEPYAKVKVLTNETTEDFVGQEFYITKNATTDGTLYPIYLDAGTTATGMYVVISTEPIVHEVEETPSVPTQLIITTDKDDTGFHNGDTVTITVNVLDENNNQITTEFSGQVTAEYCGDAWNLSAFDNENGKEFETTTPLTPDEANDLIIVFTVEPDLSETHTVTNLDKENSQEQLE